MDANELAEFFEVAAQKMRFLISVEDQLQLLQKKAKELERDAMRYRWLRDEMTASDYRKISHLSGFPFVGKILDGAIDQAMEKSK